MMFAMLVLMCPLEFLIFHRILCSQNPKKNQFIYKNLTVFVLTCLIFFKNNLIYKIIYNGMPNKVRVGSASPEKENS